MDTLLYIFLLFSLVTVTTAQRQLAIAHMTNTLGSVKWAIDKGANAIEIDLSFTREGHPYQFKHGGVCDCTCDCAFGCGANGVCAALDKETGHTCDASSGVSELMEYLGSDEPRSKLAAIYIDSKMENSITDYFGAGQRVVQLLNRYIFEKGYKGQVIISGQKVKYIDYLTGAYREATSSQFGGQYFYTFDGEGKDYNKVMTNLLSLGTKNIIYSTGITTCVGTTYETAIKMSAEADVYAGIGIWTLDKKSSMETYLSYGATAIVTNYPATAVDAIGVENLAQPGEALKPVSRDLPFVTIRTCDCGYRKGSGIFGGGGGCIITRLPPAGYACKCTYNFFKTCKGTVVNCSDPNSQDCTNPTPGPGACAQGGGDCGGYKS